MDDALLTSGMGGGMLHLESLIHDWSLPNLSSRVDEMLFPPIEQGIVYDRSLTVVAMKEAGKTSLANSLATNAIRHYGESVNVIASYEIKTAIEHMNARPVQLLIIDDAISQQNSRKSMANADDMADFFRIRHIFEDRFNTRTGVVITVFLTQRWMGLDVGFRQSHCIIYKSILTDKRDNQGIMEFVGRKAFNELKNISQEIFQHRDHAMKSTCIACLPFSQKAGHYFYKYEEPWLKFLKPGDDLYIDGTQEIFLFDRRSQILKMIRKKEWKDQAKAYYMATFEKSKYLTQEDVADALKMTHQNVSRQIKQVRGELSRIAGLEYEMFKARQLEAQGFKVDHRGGNSEPDIIATDPAKGVTQVYSCKCLEFTRPVTIELDEVRPEIATARLLKLDSVHLSVYNLASRKEFEQDYRLSQLPPRFEIEV